MKYILIGLLLYFSLLAAEMPAYKLFNSQGEEIAFEDMVEILAGADVVLFGELHDNPICHWLEFKVTESLHQEASGQVTLGAEMFEADIQLVMDEYLAGKIKTSHFEENVRLWNNYSTDYKPLFEFAKSNDLKFIATNIPRRYANIVAREGFAGLDALNDQAKKYIAPIPFPYDPELGCYKKMLNMGGMPGKMHSQSLPEAQASKDATMAYFIAKNAVSDNIFIHFNGRYHSDNRESIVWYLNEYAPDLKVMTITTDLDETLTLTAEDQNAADFIIVIPESMTRTY